MKKRDWCKPLLWVGLALLTFVVFGALNLGDKSPQKIEEKILRAAELNLETNGIEWATLNANGQVLAISGIAPSVEEKSNALNVVRSSTGHGGLILGGVTRIVDKTLIGERVSPFVWSASVKDNILTLSGHAPSIEAMKEIIDSASQRSWQSITNTLNIGVGVDDERKWIDMVKLGLAQLDGLEPGKIVVSDSHMDISGAASSNDKVDQISSVVSNLSSPFSATSSVTGPYLWFAEKTANQIRLSGLAPDLESKRAIVSAVSENFDGSIIDEMGIGGEYGWVRTILKALPQFTRFNSGILSYSNGTIFVKGNSSDSVYSFLTDDLGNIGEALGVQYDVDVSEADLDELNGLDLRQNGNNLSDVCQDAFALIMDANKIYFETGQAAISRESGDTLDKLIAVARRCNNVAIRVEGHTDNVGGREANLKLSDKRAQAVADYLIGRGYPDYRLSAIGYGSDKPAANNETPEGRARNRRIEFIVTSEENP